MSKTAKQQQHARIIFFDVTPARIKVGERVRVCYGVADTIRAGIAPLRNDIALVEKECLNDSPQKSTRYVLRAMGEDKQTETREASVEVEARLLKHARILSFEVRPNRIQRGGSVRLCYGVADAVRAGIAPDQERHRPAGERVPHRRSWTNQPVTFCEPWARTSRRRTSELTVEVVQAELPASQNYAL